MRNVRHVVVQIVKRTLLIQYSNSDIKYQQQQQFAAQTYSAAFASSGKNCLLKTFDLTDPAGLFPVGLFGRLCRAALFGGDAAADFWLRAGDLEDTVEGAMDDMGDATLD